MPDRLDAEPPQWRAHGAELHFQRNHTLATWVADRIAGGWRFITVSVGFTASASTPTALKRRYKRIEKRKLEPEELEAEEEEELEEEDDVLYASFRQPIRAFLRDLFDAQGPRSRPEYAVERLAERWLGWPEGSIARVDSLTLKKGAD